MSIRSRALLSLILCTACGATPHGRTTPEVDELAAQAALDAAAGVHDDALAALLRDHWADTLEEDPVLGTIIGDPRHDGELPEVSPEAVARRRRARAGFLSRARALTVVEPSDRVTLALFIDLLEAETGTEVCNDHLWSASPMDNPMVALNRLAPIHPLDSPSRAASYLSRLRAFGPMTRQLIENLRMGARNGLVAPRTTLERLSSFARRTVDEPIETWVAYTAAVEASASWPEVDRSAFTTDVGRILAEDVLPAFVAYAEGIEQDIVPHGRDAEHEGISALPNGAACYAAEIRRHTTAVHSAEEIHALGLREIASTDERLLALGGPHFSVSTVGEVLDHLRTDPALGYATGDEIIEDATARIRAAEEAAPRFFSMRAETACEVRPVPAAEAATTGFAFYMPGAPDGSRPGAYYVNTAEPASRRRHLVAAVTAHEAVPGHHFQITVAYGLPEMPAFRRYAEFTAYVEGWGLYAERLADEMGLYHDDVDRMGAVDLEAFRAGRLVVDTGLHALGWTRTQAEAYLSEHTSMSPDLIVSEVDRYLSWPGQALAYKVGQLALLAARARAEETLGERFSAPAFHDFVLGLGPVSLSVLDSEETEWLARQER